MNFGGAFNGLKTKYFEIFSPMLLVLLAMVMVAYLMMTYTKFGRRVVALGGNEKNAFLSGINVNRYKIIVYGISGLFCAVASIVFVAMIAPLSKPQAAPVTRPASTAIKVGRPLSNTTYITTPQTTIILPMDRSIPPEISRMLIAIVRIPSTQICWKIATMLLMPIKLGLYTK